MLKIKDNVDLKELEKFGFKYNDIDGTYGKDTHGYSLIKVNVWNKIIELHLLHNGFDIGITRKVNYMPLYDLIKADLVEKVGE